MSIHGFITGSHAYGTPKPGSDVDVVVLLNPEASNHVSVVCTDPRRGSSGEFLDSVSYKFGGLDLIVCESIEFFNEVWKAGTDELIARKPVTRDEAVEVFKRLMAEFWERHNARIDAVPLDSILAETP